MCCVVANAVRADLSKAGFVQTRISQCGYIVRGLIGWVSLGIVFVELLKSSIGGFSRSLYH